MTREEIEEIIAKNLPAFPVMALRDYFATQAMNAIIIAGPKSYINNPTNVATFAYSMADAMLKARGQE